MYMRHDFSDLKVSKTLFVKERLKISSRKISQDVIALQPNPV